MRRFLLTLALLASSAVAASAQGPAVFVGTDGNWFNPRNWSTGQVPGPNTDVLIERGREVVIDPALGGDTVRVRDLTVTTGGRLTTLPGTKFRSRMEVVMDGGLVHQSTEAAGDFLFADNPSGPRCVSCGIKFNPSPQSKRTIVLKISVQTEFGLGGPVAAAPGRTGRGHYATLTTDWGMIGGDLKLNLHYGFVPTPGQTFTIVKARYMLFGEFNHLPEGALVERFGDVGLFISYRGIWGREVVLTARDMR
jgi:hypothetical protein